MNPIFAAFATTNILTGFILFEGSDATSTAVYGLLITNLFGLLSLIANQFYQNRAADHKRQWDKEDRDAVARAADLKAQQTALEVKLALEEKAEDLAQIVDAKAKALARLTKAQGDAIAADAKQQRDQIAAHLDTKLAEYHEVTNNVNEKIAGLASSTVAIDQANRIEATGDDSNSRIKTLEGEIVKKQDKPSLSRVADQVDRIEATGDDSNVRIKTLEVEIVKKQDNPEVK